MAPMVSRESLGPMMCGSSDANNGIQRARPDSVTAAAAAMPTTASRTSATISCERRTVTR
jgi:hypothetical protein